MALEDAYFDIIICREFLHANLGLVVNTSESIQGSEKVPTGLERIASAELSTSY